MKNKQVKIIATLGPASDKYETIRSLAKAGVNIFRINLSHATLEEINNRFKWIRDAEKELGFPIAIMGDLAGPKIRIDEVSPGIVLEKGQHILISKEHVMGNSNVISLNHPSIISMVEPLSSIYLDDGAIKLHAVKRVDKGIEAVVEVGGELKSRKGFMAEGIALSKSGISPKDRDAVKLMVEKGADALAISFVQSARDAEEVKKLLPNDSQIMLVAKIETARGVENAEKILDVVDALMVARGDLGLSVPMAKVPHIQKELIKLCLGKAKPVITATQMLESMISRSIPTRAEVSDVANAILDGSGCVMLSAETATGIFPVETVETMVKIIEESLQYIEHIRFDEQDSVGDAVSAAAGNVADQIGAKLILVYTEKGVTARKISRHRHKKPIIALSANDATIHRLNFSWGVYPHKIDKVSGFDNILHTAKDIARHNRILPLNKGDKYIISAGIPYGKSGSTNFIYVDKV